MAHISEKASRPMRFVSRDTLIFFAALIAIALAGFNSGNNLLYLVGGVMMGSVFIALIAGRINLSRIDVTRRLPTYVFARHPFRMELEIANNKRLCRSFGISLEEGTEQREPLFILSVENGGRERRGMDVSVGRRGLHRFPPIIVRSRFPFGLFTLKRRLADPKQIVVYPHISDLGKAPGGSSRIQDEFPRHLKGPGSGLYGMREYRHGEEASNISWKLSAKLDKLIVRETEAEEKRRVCIIFDNALKDRSTAALKAFERAVSNAASLAWYLCGQGYSVKLVTRDKIIGYGEGAEQAHRILITLALVEATDAAEEEVRAGRFVFEGGTGVLVTCGTEAAGIHSSKCDFALVLRERITAEAP